MTDFTMVRSSSSLMARSASSARSSMLMAWIIAVPVQQIFTFATHHLHAQRPSSPAWEATGAALKTQPGGRAMTRRTFQRLTAVALTGLAATAGALVTVRAYAQGPHGPHGMHAGIMKRMVTAALDGALDQAAGTPGPAARHGAAGPCYRRRVPIATAALLSDDDARLGALVTEYLGRHEIDVTVAADGERGLSVLRKGRFDVVLLDVMLPGADGFEV